MSARHRRTRDLRATVAVSLGAALSLVALAGPAAGSSATPAGDRPNDQSITIPDPPPAGFRSWEEVHAAQARISAVADRIEEAANRLDRAGFGSIITEPATHRIRLYWKGELPESVRTAFARETDVSVVIERAAYAETELQAEISRMIHPEPLRAATEENHVTGAAPLPDASGLRVFVSGDAESGRELPEVRAATVPVTVEGGVTPEATSRNDDWSPYYGGARWYGKGGCSTGFAVMLNGMRKMVSAGHCASNGTTAVDGGGDVMGTITQTNSPMLDTLLINVDSAGRVFNGGPGNGEFTNKVLGLHYNHAGDYVCTSGAYSGTRCNIKIVDTNVTANFLLPDGKTLVTYNRMSRAEQQGGLNAAGNGDSGGPVFEVDADTTKVWARGTITGGNSKNAKATCTGVPEGGGRYCSWRIWYTSIAQSRNAFGFTIVTG